MSEQALEQEAEEETLTAVQKLLDQWPGLPTEERLTAFMSLPRSEAEELFYGLGAADRLDLLVPLSRVQQRSWIRLLEPDDVTDLIQEAPAEERQILVGLGHRRRLVCYP